MDNIKIGNFIREERTLHNIALNDFAQKLDVSEELVSEWENGTSAPDISVFSKVADLLNVTIDELINGKRISSSSQDCTAIVKSSGRFRRSKEERCELARRIALFSVTMTFLTGILASIIVDFAITKRLTWSLYPISSCIFAWLVMFPVLMGGLKKTYLSLLVFSFTVLPFLYSICMILHEAGLFWMISLSTAVPSIIFMWIVFAIFKILRKRKFLATAVALFAAIPFNVLINFIISGILHYSVHNIWNIIPLAIILFTAMTFLMIDSFVHWKKA